MDKSNWAVVEQFNGEESEGIHIQAAQKTIAIMSGIGAIDFDAARLIAAAPDLLKALQAILQTAAKFDSPDTRFYVKVASAAIAKATSGAA